MTINEFGHILGPRSHIFKMLEPTHMSIYRRNTIKCSDDLVAARSMPLYIAKVMVIIALILI